MLSSTMYSKFASPLCSKMIKLSPQKMKALHNQNSAKLIKSRSSTKTLFSKPSTSFVPCKYYSISSTMKSEPIGSSILSLSPHLRATNRSEIFESDLIDLKIYEQKRRSDFFKLRKYLKKDRFILIGPYASLTFENYDLMWLQIHEMLLIERGGSEQIKDELSAYNPLIPKGNNIVITLMFEIVNPEHRSRELMKLGHVEDTLKLSFENDGRKHVLPASSIDGHDFERTTPEGKTSAVHFLKFDFDAQQKEDFLALANKAQNSKFESNVLISIGHPHYKHSTELTRHTLIEISKDLF